VRIDEELVEIWPNEVCDRNQTHSVKGTLCQEHAEWEQSNLEWSGITPEWKGVDNKSEGITLASARVLCLDLLSHVWLYISGGLNCCQEFWRGID